MPLPTVSSGDSGHVAYHNLIHALMPTGESVTVYTKAGTPADGDFTSTPTNGTIAINTSTNRVWYRKAGTWTEITAAVATPTSIDQPSAGAVGDDIVKSKLTADTQYRFVQNADGKLEWGSGSAVGDTNLYRSDDANTLKTDDKLYISAPAGVEALQTDVSGHSTPGLIFKNIDAGGRQWYFIAAATGTSHATGAGGLTVYDGSAGAERLGLHTTAADGETILFISRNVGGTYSMQRVSMGATDSGGAGFKVLRVPN